MIYFFLADGFEEVEAICPLDLLRRAGLEVKTVGIGKREIVGAHGIEIRADMLDSEYCDSAPELIFLPGGMPGTLNLLASDVVKSAVLTAHKNNAYIAAICAAPMILGELGLLQGKEAICYPGFEDKLRGAYLSDKRTVADGKILTAAGMGVALDFGLLIVSILKGEDKAKELRSAVIAD
ncbi:MAG: DJ-1/PfpI family protein [Ruminococcaceae bacterium]|nr:DJ-1/PfpI family protein [Oscillospiraceae bacterium]